MIGTELSDPLARRRYQGLKSSRPMAVDVRWGEAGRMSVRAGSILTNLVA